MSIYYNVEADNKKEIIDFDIEKNSFLINSKHTNNIYNRFHIKIIKLSLAYDPLSQ